ncbi:hypothetical protein ITJ43_03445 [Microbacterium sp. VKM Ac-2870]|uniref:hypothetical protein n=1 Tax=Microbacterium sp. VKM Ac-2870 TaxID=2783825 RepID=UPI00188A2C4E|nr:hypothetical protein [Microbacterium sp. VKM Ac-2870]MBF4561181.1 hypothetical protein [Microbacterium sp. VKM Ac-2870]
MAVSQLASTMRRRVAGAFTHRSVRLLFITASVAMAAMTAVSYVTSDPGLRDDPWPQAGLALAAIGLFVVYLLGVRIAQTQTRAGRKPAPREKFAQLTLVDQYFDALRRDNRLISAQFFFQMVCKPRSRILRISERATLYTRSTSIHSTFTISAPDADSSGPMVTPLILQPKSTLLNSVKFIIGGERVSSLTQVQAIAYSAAVIRYLVSEVNEDALAIYRDQIEVRVYEILSRSDTGAVPFDSYVNRVCENIRALPGVESRHDQIIQAAILLISRLRKRYAVCVVAEFPVPAAAGSGLVATLTRTLRVSMERKMVVTRVGHRQPVQDGAGLARRFLIVTWQLVLRALDSARQTFGVQSSVISYPLDNASRTSSYHLQIQGAEGTYLASQEIVRSDPSSAGFHADHVGFQARLGQRSSHLYVRNGRSFSGHVVVNDFFERMPGSMAPAALSSFAATAIICLCAAIKLQLWGVSLQSTDLVAVLLALPAVAALWVGIENRYSALGGVLAAKVSAGVTMGSALYAAALYVIVVPEPQLERALWIGAVTVAGINLVATIGSWQLRSSVQRYFTGRRIANS